MYVLFFSQKLVVTVYLNIEAIDVEGFGGFIISLWMSLSLACLHRSNIKAIFSAALNKLASYFQ